VIARAALLKMGTQKRKKKPRLEAHLLPFLSIHPYQLDRRVVL
jgi:hypothetical protein